MAALSSGFESLSPNPNSNASPEAVSETAPAASDNRAKAARETGPAAAPESGPAATPPSNERPNLSREEGQNVLDQRVSDARSTLESAQAREQEIIQSNFGGVPTQDGDRQQVDAAREVAQARNALDQAERFAEAGPPSEVGTVIGVHGLYDGANGTIKEVTDYLTSTGVNTDGGVIDFANEGVRDRLAGGELTAERIQAMSPEDRSQLARDLGLNPDGNVFRVQFQSDTDNASNNASQLAAATEVALGFTGDQEADLVAHSKGGVDSREYLNNPDERVRTLTTLATPHQGSGLADWANWAESIGADGWNASRNADTPTNPAVDELVPGSEFLGDLNGNTALHNERLDGALSIAGTGDWAVGVDSALGFDGAITRTIDDAGHSSVTQSPSALRTVSDFLGGEQLAPTGELAYNIPQEVPDTMLASTAGSGGFWDFLFPRAHAATPN